MGSSTLRSTKMDNEGILVMKFGGTSVGKGMAQCVSIVKEQRSKRKKVVVVTSALTQVTNKLLESAQKACSGDCDLYVQRAEEIRAQHETLCKETLKLPKEETDRAMTTVDRHLKTFSELCHAMSILGECSDRGTDAVSALGERMSVGVLAAAIRCADVEAEAVDAKDVIITDDKFQDAHPDMEASTVKATETLMPMLDRGVVPVITGFLASNKSGATTTLGRGGSDYSAAIIGALLSASAVWIWTDVNGIMTADPRIATNAQTIPKLSLREVAEMSYFGAKVLHAKTIRPVVQQGIPLRICNTFDPQNPGTIVKDMVSEDAAKNGDAKRRAGYKAVTSVSSCNLVTVTGRGMLGVVGVAARAFTAIAAAHASVLLITQGSSEQSICFAVPSKTADGVVASLNSAFAQDIARGDIENAAVGEDCSIITVVGAEMVHTVGVAGLVFTALGDAGVNVMAISQGSSEVSISAVVAAADTSKAVVALHACTTPLTPHNSPSLKKRKHKDIEPTKL